jgi:pyruvate dehydrogenase E2 component (dihydrolipoamide acetyltransferase)
MGKRFEPLEKTSSWRKISVGMWDVPSDPTIYGFETVDVSKLLPYLDEVSRISGTKVGVAAYCVKGMATVFETYPTLNVVMIGKKVVRRKSTDIFCQVAVPSDHAERVDLSGVNLRGADEMDLVEIAKRLSSRATDVRTGQDAEMEKTKSMVDIVPPWLMGKMLKFVDFLTFNVPFDLDRFGIRSDPFGSAMVTSVGQFGIRQGFAPLVPVSRVPVVVCPGVLHKAPFVTDDGEVVGRDALTVSCTFDHRVYDGCQGGLITGLLRDILMHPTKHYPEPEYWAQPEADTESEQSPRPEDREAKPAPAE